MKVLGIETSCDETAASVIEGSGGQIKVLSNIVSSQIEIHKKYNGVVPEVAAREHVLNILPVINEALEKADTKGGEIDVIAVTVGPGLITSLITGIETAKTLAYAWNLPVVAVNHIEAHIYSNFIEPKEKIKLPALVLTVSGGHTQLVLMEGYGKFKTIGSTLDDAAGEAFDKAAKLMNLGYPGGPFVSARAEEFSGEKKIELARPMINSSDFNFSFSGLKTSLLYSLKKDKDWKKKIPEYAHEFQQAIIDVLIKKTVRAGKKYKVETVMLSGGVSANRELREQLEKRAEKEGFLFLKPDLQYTTDNATMVAVAGYFKAKKKEFMPWKNLKANCNLEI